MFRIAFALLFLSSTAFARVSCEEELAAGTSLIFGRSTLHNLAVLRNVELIEPEVRARFQEEVLRSPQLTRRELAQTAARFAASPTRRNQEVLFDALRILVPLASRHLLAHLPNRESLDDCFQTGFLALWKALEPIARLNPEDLRSVFYFEAVSHNLRKSVFASMREQFRTQYSLTPVRFRRGSEFTFEEEILLFGDTPAARAKIAKHYGRKAEEAEREWRIQGDSVAINDSREEAISHGEETPSDWLQSADVRAIVTKMMSTIGPREERVLRMAYWKDFTLDQMGEEIGVSRERVRQIEYRGIRRLRHPSRWRHNGARFQVGDLIETGPPGVYVDREYHDPKYRIEQRDKREREELERQAQREARAREREAERERERAELETKARESRERAEAEKAELDSRLAQETELRQQWIETKLKPLTGDAEKLFQQLAEVLEDTDLQDEVQRLNTLRGKADTLKLEARADFVKINPVLTEKISASTDFQLQREREIHEASAEKILRRMATQNERLTVALSEILLVEKRAREQGEPLMQEIGAIRRAYEMFKTMEDEGTASAETVSNREAFGRLLREKEAAHSAQRREARAQLETAVRNWLARLANEPILF